MIRRPQGYYRITEMLCCNKPRQFLKAVEKFSKSSWILQSYSFSDAPYKKSKLAPLQERRMIDRRRIWAKGGDGGNGCSSFRRSRRDRFGRPDGGNGGRGGDVILECSPAVWDLSSLQHHINAKRGGHGAPKNMIGSRGDDKVALVPVGTVIHLIEGEIPSAVEKVSSTALHPWEIPGTADQSETGTGTRTEKTLATKSGSSCKVRVKESTKVKKPSRISTYETVSQASRFCTESGIYSAEWNDLGDESSCECEAPEIGTGLSEGESEEVEVTKFEEHIEYNVAELTEPGERIIVARGGNGGLGNVSSSKNFRETDTKKYEDVRDNVFESEECDDVENSSLGLPGSKTVLILELKSIADVGLAGMPNAGKSTLLGALSKAKPAVGHYAFTTLRPNLGNVNYEDFSVTVADIPGLIKGAHQNRGLGHAFLRHIERTRVLAYVVDLAAALDGRKGTPPWEQLRDLILELEFHREGMSDRPALVVANKIDEAGAEEVYDELRKRVPGVPIFPVCAVLEEGVPKLKDGLKMLVNGGESYRLTLDGIDVN